MNATEAVTVIRFLRMQLASTPQTDPGAATLQSVIDHLGMEVKRLTAPAVDDGGPAFPWGEHGDRLGGMSVRDVFACHAPQPPDLWRGGDRKIQDVIEWRWYYADAMLKARLA